MKTKIKNINMSFCFPAVLTVVVLMLPVVFVQGVNNWILVPPEAVFPLGKLSAEDQPLFDVGSGVVNMLVDTDNAGLVKVAPGELLPISIKLANFGGGKRVDVLLTYTILTSTEEKIYESNETVAVETTASFVRTIQIPFYTTGGVYTAKTSISYLGQVVPATTQFPFTVEQRILGLFKTDFYFYGVITFIVGLACFVLGRFLIRRRGRRGILHDYSDKPHDERIYYEMVSDIITQMRLRTGERAIQIAVETEGLVVDRETGRVLDITESPAQVVAGLVSRYEKNLGEKSSFSLRPNKKL